MDLSHFEKNSNGSNEFFGSESEIEFVDELRREKLEQAFQISEAEEVPKNTTNKRGQKFQKKQENQRKLQNLQN